MFCEKLLRRVVCCGSLIGVVCLSFCFVSVAQSRDEVVVYTSVDQVFSEPVLELFEKESGIRVKAVYDVEAAKTVGLVNRLIVEAKHPKADVFWNSEITRTILLKEKGLLAPYFSPSAEDIPATFKDPEGFWAGFGCRARVLIYNTTMLSREEAPASVFELADEKWKGKAAMAYPLLGTAATHMGALYSALGTEKAEQFLQQLKDNDILIVSGNSVVRDVVVAAQVPVGLTDTDDVFTAIARNQPVDFIIPDQDGLGAFMIPNTVAMIKDGPNPEPAKRLVDYLLSKSVEQFLADSKSGNIPARGDVKPSVFMPRDIDLKAMDVDYQKASENVPLSDVYCRRLFQQ